MVTTTNETTVVRAGEELDLLALDNYLKRRLSEQLTDFPTGSKIEVEQFPGGHSNLTYLIRYGTHDFVLRRPPVGPVAVTAHDMPREYKLLSVINPHFPLAPKPILLCEDTSVVGVPFYLMERRNGLIVRFTLPVELNENLVLRRRLSEQAVNTLVALHAVDIYGSGIVNIGKPEGFVGRQVHGWADRWQRSKTKEIPEMEEVIAWLTARIPTGTTNKATIVHNDFKLDNLMLDAADPAKVVAVLDWEMCTVGDPLIDLGLFLTYWTMEGGNQHSSLRAVTNGPGWMTREEIIEQYQLMTGYDLSQISFYETFASFKVAVVIQQIYFRYARGQTRDSRFRHLDALVEELIQTAFKTAKSKSQL
jgi:aminoglycoside phosphotransferase (APT) family kinase protein